MSIRMFPEIDTSSEKRGFDLKSNFHIMLKAYTVDSLISGHHWGKDFCPLIRGVRLLESL